MVGDQESAANHGMNKWEIKAIRKGNKVMAAERK